MDNATTELLADWALGIEPETLSDDVIAKTLDCVLDNLASALAGQEQLPVRAAQVSTKAIFGSGHSKIWFSGRHCSPAGAAFCNGLAASSLDLDDGHRQARGHPGSAIVPAVLASAQDVGSSDLDVICAIAVGYEIAVRAAKAQNPQSFKTHQTGRWVGLGVVAACGRLAKLSTHQMANAFAIAQVWAPNQLANGSSGYASDTGNWAKEGIPIALFEAMVAVHLAKNGFTGPRDVFDFESHYDNRALVTDLGTPSAILGTYFKRYGCCRYIHPALDAWQRQFGGGKLDVNEIERVEVWTFGWALKLANKIWPNTLVDIQFSLPYCLALAMLYGLDALREIGVERIGDAKASALAKRIDMHIDPQLDRQFPQKTLAQLRIRTRSGHTLNSPPNVEPQKLGHDEIIAKFYAVAAGKISHARSQDMVRALEPETLALDVLYPLL